jgi:hypothetical protein
MVRPVKTRTDGLTGSITGPVFKTMLSGRNTKKIIPRFTNSDNHTNEIPIYQSTYSLELLHFTSLYYILIFLH